MSRKSCCVSGCQKTNISNPECTFNPLPTEVSRQHEWLKAIGRSDLMLQAHMHPFYVCSSHFEDEDLKCTSLLLPNALPSRHLPETSSDTPQRSQIDKSSSVLEIKGDEQPQNDVLLELQDELTKNIRKLIKDQTVVEKDRNSKEFLFYALNLYLLNPQTYNFIRETLNLPSEKVLKKIKLKITPKLDKEALDCLSSKLKSFPDKAKYCTVCIEAVNLKNNMYYEISNDELIGLQEINGVKTDELARMAYVVMLRSILVKWDQPVAYCFLSGNKNVAQLESWVDGIITSLLDIGFEVMALVTNQGSGVKKLATEIKRISPKEPYFVLNNKKIYYIVDFPQLLNYLRTNFGSKDISYDNKRLSWQYIESLFQLESKKTHKIIPKIISGHVTLHNVTKMTTVKCAAEIFSNTASTAIHAYVDTKELPEDARDTADFCLFLNNLFDVLNSSTYENDNMYKCALGSNESQMKLLQEAVNVFSNLQWKFAEHKKETQKTRGGNKKTPHNHRTTFPDIQITLNSVISIAQDLNKLGHKLLLTQRLNLEPLDKFADLIRGVSSKRETKEAIKPSAIKFSRNFSKQFVKYILTKSPLSNRPSAFQKYFEDATLLEISKISDIPSRPLILLGRGETDYRMQLPKDHPTIYVASYIFYKCQKTHNCNMLDHYVSTLPDLAKTKVYDVYNKKAPFYGKLKLLTYPFIRYIEQLELAFTQVFNKGVWSTPEHPGSQAFTNLRPIPFPDPPCKCFPKIYAVKLLIRLRIYATIKAYNKRIKNQNINLSQFLSELSRKLEEVK
ncbi:uncharacterized protein LOC134671290 [Cydia fagiglandana]|uniref:uncharacterized protein LOC134671290 n=1 Tax=Cydia fagiglandana TaxID=1458189 RepID=UPI002FEE6063